MNLNELANSVARQADTEGTQINVAEVKRCISILFKQLATQPAPVALCIVARGLEQAWKDNDKEEHADTAAQS